MFHCQKYFYETDGREKTQNLQICIIFFAAALSITCTMSSAPVDHSSLL